MKPVDNRKQPGNNDGMNPADYLGLTSTARRWGISRQRALQLLPRVPAKFKRTLDGRHYVHVSAKKPEAGKAGRPKNPGSRK